MKILFDTQLFECPYLCGINKCYGILFNNLSEIVVQPTYIKNPFVNQERFSSSIFYVKKNFCTKNKKLLLLTFVKKIFPFLKLEQKIHKKNNRQFLSRIKENNFDILHLDLAWFPSDEIFSAIEENVTKPIVVLVCDVMGNSVLPTDPNYHTRINISKQKLRLLQKAAKIIAISNQTKTDLMNLFSVAEEKIEVVYNCYEKLKAVKPAGDMPKKYILYIGQRFGRKNFHFFVNSIRDILFSDQELHVVFTMQNFTDEERAYIGYLGIIDRFKFIDAGSENNLAYLCENALVCAVPSLYEGFGMIVLESMIYGCPVVTSDLNIMREVGGDAAQYFNPLDQFSIKSVMQKVLSDSGLRASMIEAGFKQAEKFSVKKTIDGMKKVYSESIQ